MKIFLFLSFHGTCCQPGNDASCHEEVYDDDREDGHEDEHIYLCHVKFQEICRAEGRDQDRQGLFAVGFQYQCRDEVIVPAGDERKDGLYGNSRFHHGNGNLVEGPYLAGAVNAR